MEGFKLGFNSQYTQGVEFLSFDSWRRSLILDAISVEASDGSRGVRDAVMPEIIRLIMNGCFGGSDYFTMQIAEALRQDLCRFINKHLPGTIDTKEMKSSLDDAEIASLGITSEVAEKIIRPNEMPFTTRYDNNFCEEFCPIIRTALVLLNVAQTKGCEINYLEDFACLEKCLHHTRVEVEAAFLLDVGEGYKGDSYSSLINTPENLNRFRVKEALVHDTVEKIKEEIGIVPGGFANGRIYPIGFEDDGTYQPFALQNRGRCYEEPSANVVKSNAVLATPVEGIMRFEVDNSRFRTSLTEDRKKDGPWVSYEMAKINLNVAFRFNHDTKNNKRLIPPANKQYKLYAEDNIPIMLDTIRTLAENPNSMFFDIRSINNSDTMVLRPAATKQVFASEKDIKQYIKEVIRDEFGSTLDSRDMFKAFLQLAGVFQEKGDDYSSDDMPNLTAYNISKFKGKGFDTMHIDYDKYAPDSYLRILENLEDLSKTFEWLATQAKAINEYISEKAKTINYSVDKKITYRDFIAEMILSESKIDPIALSSSPYPWIQNIAKALF